jgi:hypothetical protein
MRSVRKNKQPDNRLKIFSFNTHGLTNSVPKLNEYIKSGMIFVQEHMTVDRSLFIASFENNEELKFHFNKAKKGRGRGRPSMGIAFVHNVTLKSKCYFENYRIGVLKYENLAIIGAYMIYESKSKPENETQFLCDLETIRRIYNNLMSEGYDAFITGDLNTDFNRPSPFRSHLLSLMNDLGLTSAAHIISQPINYTYKTEHTWIDHTLVNLALLPKIRTDIVYDDDVDSDHYAIVTETPVKLRPINDNNTFTRKCAIPLTRLQDFKFRSKVQNSIENYLINVCNKLEDMLNQDSVIEHDLTELVEDLDDTIQNEMLKANNSENGMYQNNYKKTNPWWNSLADELHMRKMELVKIKNKSESDKFEICSLKKRINGIKKNYKKKHRLDKNRNLSKLHKFDKNKFWRTLNNSLKINAEPSLNIKLIKNDFEKIFNDKLISNDVLEQNSLHKLNDLLAQPTDVSEEIEVDEYKIESIIKNMSNGKMAGHCGVSADMIKCLTFKTKTQNQVEHEQTLVTPPNTIVKTIKLILDVIFKFNVFPKDFNLSIMIPLIKDPSKSRSDLNNIRPISISGYLSNIYERLILSMVDQRHKQPEKQFGFNKNCSCSHAVFVLMETLKYIKKKTKTWNNNGNRCIKGIRQSQ